jgi:hypothetical protein
MIANEKIEVGDTLETMLIMLLELDSIKNTFENKPHLLKHNGKLVKARFLHKTEEMKPQKTYTLDIEDKNRLTTERIFLLNNPIELIGNKNEFTYFLDNRACWYGIKKINKKPESITFLGKPDVFYEVHSRNYYINGNKQYVNCFMALDKNGKVLPSFTKRTKDVQVPNFVEIMNKFIVYFCSAIEDAHRTNAMLAQVKDQVEIIFPVPLDNYKEIFSNRDKQPNEIRRKSILHWVSKHLRKKPPSGLTLIKRHTRGIDEFTVDGLSVKISAN